MISLSRNGKPSLLISPNSVLANALLRTIDLVRPRVLAARPARIEFVVGTQINGAPHLGTNLVQTAAFLLAKTARREFSVEIRVNDSSRKKIKEGAMIRFRCQGDQVLTRVTRVARYTSFEEMFDHEEVTSVNPLATREGQLANIRQIYPPERKALGVVAIGIELVDPPRPV